MRGRPVALHVPQARKIGFGRGDVAALRRNRFIQRLQIGKLRLILRLILIVLLPRNHAFGVQRAPALRGDFGEFHVRLALLIARLRLFQRGLRLFERGLGLQHLLIELGRFDFGYDLAGVDAVADIGRAPPDVAIGARQDRRFRYGLDAARQLQFALRRSARSR